MQPAPAAAQIVLLTFAAALWFVPKWRWRAVALILFAAGAFAVSLALLRSNIELPLGEAVRIALIAVAARSALEAWQVRQDRTRLKTLFGGYVSPGVLAAILAGKLVEDARRGRRELCSLFADLRDFTAISEKAAPETVLALLNRYYAAITPVLHAYGGTVDNFRGDGLMAIFGAPNRLDNPARAGIDAARAMLARLSDLNRELAVENAAPLAIGVTLAYGEAVVGNVGSTERYNYTAIGDGANVAARLQDLAKSSGYPLVATRAVVDHASGDAAAGWTTLGDAPIRGHAPAPAFGWKPAA